MGRIFLGETDEFASGLFVSRRKMIERAQKAPDRFGAQQISAAMPAGAPDFQDRKLAEFVPLLYLLQ